MFFNIYKIHENELKILENDVVDSKQQRKYNNSALYLYNSPESNSSLNYSRNNSSGYESNHSINDFDEIKDSNSRENLREEPIKIHPSLVKQYRNNIMDNSHIYEDISHKNINGSYPQSNRKNFVKNSSINSLKKSKTNTEAKCLAQIQQRATAMRAKSPPPPVFISPKGLLAPPPESIHKKSSKRVNDLKNLFENEINLINKVYPFDRNINFYDNKLFDFELKNRECYNHLDHGQVSRF
jgi:hypothetical protein